MNWKHLATAASLATLTFACDDAALSAEDWLRWNDERGFPSITFNSSGLHVTLPEGLLAEAIALGKSREQAVVSFLNRYAPGMCTDMSDMQVSHTGLPVHVRLQRELEEFLPHHASVVDDAEQDFVVNYAPKKPGRCIDPDASS